MIIKYAKKEIEKLGFDLPDKFEHGWFTDDNKNVLDKFLNKETKVIIELGTWLGSSVLYMLKKAPAASIYCVDRFFSSDPEIHKARLTYFEKYMPERKKYFEKPQDFYNTFLANIADYSDRVFTIAGMTDEAIKSLFVTGKQPHLIYIDADHSYQAVKRDLRLCEMYFPHAQIVGDDWHRNSVKAAVLEIAGAERIKNINNCWYLEG